MPHYNWMRNSKQLQIDVETTLGYACTAKAAAFCA